MAVTVACQAKIYIIKDYAADLAAAVKNGFGDSLSEFNRVSPH
jgi:hypothetical protein